MISEVFSQLTEGYFLNRKKLHHAVAFKVLVRQESFKLVRANQSDNCLQIFNQKNLHSYPMLQAEITTILVIKCMGHMDPKINLADMRSMDFYFFFN